MTSPELNVFAYPEVGGGRALPEFTDVALAEIDSDGCVLSLNTFAKTVWGWKKGDRLPLPLITTLGAGEPLELIDRHNGLPVMSISAKRENGWLLVGSHEKNEPADNKESNFRTLIENISPANQLAPLKNVFIAMMSHEIRTPLGVMNGYAEILGQELEEYEATTGNKLPHQIKEFVDAIHENAQRLLGIANEMFDLSNMRQLSLSPIGLHEILEPIAEQARQALAEKEVLFETHFSPEDLIVFGNAARLGQVFKNLLSNAVKFTHHGSVSASTRRQGEEVVIEVADTGIGISEDHMDQLFVPFLQEDTRLNRNFAGAGLGLAVVKLLVDLMKGRIEVESEKGRGSTFRVFLPAVE